MIVYRYFRWYDFAKLLFTNNELYLGHPSIYNDPFDFAAKEKFKGPKVVDEIKRMPKLKRDTLVYLLNQSKDPVEEYYKIYEDLINANGICCFSESFDNILMWAHYTDNHSGICVAFDTDLLEDKDIHFYKVLYRKKLPIVEISLSREKQIRQLRTKYIDWKYEQEIRAIKQFNRPNIGDEERKWFIKKEAITGLYLGSRMKKDTSSEIRKLYLDNNFSIPVFQMRVSQEIGEYKLIAHKLR